MAVGEQIAPPGPGADGEPGQTSRYRLTAAQVMTSPVIVARTDMKVGELVELLRRQQISGVPVVDAADQLAGVISITDLIGLSSDHPAGGSVCESDFHSSPAMDGFSRLGGLLQPDEAVCGRPVADFMSRRVVTATEDAPLGLLAAKLVSFRIHRLIVVRGQLVIGIITLRDILRALQRLDGAAD